LAGVGRRPPPRHAHLNRRDGRRFHPAKAAETRRPAHSAREILAFFQSLPEAETVLGEEPSSSDKLLADMLAAMGPHGVSGEIVRVADHDVGPAVSSDKGPGDDWPDLRKRILTADIFILGMPIWLGGPPASPRGC
jgi:hypothetical protein